MLSPAQYDAVCLVLGGARTGDAAEILGLSPGTVSNHVRAAGERDASLGTAIAVARQLHRAHRYNVGRRPRHAKEHNMTNQP